MRLLVLIMIAFTAACSPAQVSSKLVVPPLPAPKTVGSLWQEENGRAYLYEDLRAMRVGDILTIKIVEKHKGSKSADTAAQRESSLAAGLEGVTTPTPGAFLGIPGVFLNGRTQQGLGVDGSFKSKFGGKGATNREDTLTGTLSAMVTDVMPNGDLRIEGTREVSVNSERQMMTLSGIVRRVDVDTKNTVLSSAIAEAKIAYSGLGIVDDVQRTGWLVRVLSWIYPF